MVNSITLFLCKNQKMYNMELKIAERKYAKMKMAVQGPSGSGKTYSALLLAYGLIGNWEKVAVIDTENESSNLYAHLGSFRVLSLSEPFTPEKYIDAIHLCEKAGMEVIIIDSITHEWENLLEYHGSLAGNSFSNWNKVTPRHNHFVQKILQSTCHIIATIRTKQDYVLADKNGKMVPEKVGLKSVQRENIDYEFTLVFDLDIKNHATTSKDRTGLFMDTPAVKLSIDTGTQIKKWCERQDTETIDQVSQRINGCKSLNELLSLYKEFPQFKKVLLPEYENQKRKLLLANVDANITQPLKPSENGSH
jgi:hypothetical protein